MVIRGQVLVAEDEERLVAVPGTEDGQNATDYFIEGGSDEEELTAATQAALGVIGAWSDLDWDEAYEALDRVRHESDPLPPIDHLYEAKTQARISVSGRRT